MRCQPIEHRLRLADILAVPLTAADYRNRIRIGFEIAERALEPVRHGKRRRRPVHGGTEHDEVLPFRILIRARICDYRYLHDAEIYKPDAHQRRHGAPRAARQIVMQHYQGGDEAQCVAYVRVAAHRKAEHQRRREQRGSPQNPIRYTFQTVHPFSSSHCSYSSRSSFSSPSRSADSSMSF